MSTALDYVEQDVDVSRDIESLLSRLPSHDMVIGMLRYGAHLPHLCELALPMNLVLSHIVPFMNRAAFADKKIVILDDTIYRGSEMQRIMQDLTDRMGVTLAQLYRAVAIVNSRSKYLPDNDAPRLKDADYIVWKESLASLVRGGLRPTERDYPLYYFETADLSLGRMLSHLHRFGALHPASADLAGKAFRATLTLSSDLLGDVRDLPGLDVEDVCKIRFHFYRTCENGPLRMVVIPMAFSRLTIDHFLESGSGEVLAANLGLRSAFYRDVYTSDSAEPRAFLYYMVSRSLGAVALNSFLTRLSARFGTATLVSLPSEKIDGNVRYVFPPLYTEFYEHVREALPLVSGGEQLDLVDSLNWRPRDGGVQRELKRDPIIPESYQITEFVCAKTKPAKWERKEWVPNSELGQGVAHRELLAYFRNPLFVSAALDDLIDSGLLRAQDCAMDAASNVWERMLFPGGEFKAQEIHTVADAWGVETGVSDDVVREELLELWGPF